VRRRHGIEIAVSGGIILAFIAGVIVVNQMVAADERSARARTAATPPITSLSARCPTAPDVDPSAAPAADPVAATAAAAIPEDEFWALVEQVGARDVDDRAAALSSALEYCTLDELVGFDARLTLILYSLDTAAACHWRLAHDPGFDAEYSDDFLDERADTVLAGRATTEKAVADGTLPWGDVDPGSGEDLLYIAGTAADTSGRTDSFDKLSTERILISYESGSNPASAMPGDVQTACTAG
jgi:hypothetical protein